MPGFTDQAPITDYTKCKNGTYSATVVSAAVVKENGQPKYLVSDNGTKKLQIDVRLQLDLKDDEGNPIELSRRFGLTFGKNRSTGSYSGWAQFVQAATGVRAGDAGQHHVGDKELQGRRLTVWTKNVESNGNRYTNAIDFEPIEEEARPAPRAAAPAHAPASAVGLDEDDLSELPF